LADNLSDVVQAALTGAPFTTRELAEESGLSYDVLRSWRSGRRRATAMSARRLAEGLEARGRRLLALAREIQKQTGRV
jgi:transcriptional regulator with XRE-family HTH domain